ncbi:DUF3807 domain containing protein [Pyrenophora tritici-repentis]|nr:DUF3807 domain containing protein [Pyrenophora tritici-repentis]
MEIPTVTIADLRAFHAKHFPHAPAPEHVLYGVEPEAQAAEEYYDEADDGLGYYSDGTKRTLTDEQIAMFRHSEIHAILRKRQLRKEDGEISDADSIPTVPALMSAATNDCSLHKNVDTAQSDAIEKPKQQWATTSATSKAKAKRKRDKYAKRRKEKRLERGLPRRRGGRNGADVDDSSDESDEWDPWHQANGPDVQKDDTLDLDY